MSNQPFGAANLDSLSQELLGVLAKYSHLLELAGYPAVRTHSDSALRTFAGLVDERKFEILKRLESDCEILNNIEEAAQLDVETAILKRALKKLGMQAHSDFWATMTTGQIVEIYGDDMIQLFRSFTFFSVTGYSLLDINIYEWFVLWDRPKRVMDAVRAELTEILQKKTPFKRFNTPKHIIRETHNWGETQMFVPRASVAEFLFAGALSPTDASNPRHGFIVSSVGELVAIGDEARAIQFI